MNARFLLGLSAAAVVLAAAPATARESETARMAEKMSDPATQRQMARAVAAMSEAMLDIPLEPFARAADAVGDRRTARKMRGSTLRDVAGPEAEAMPREISRKLPAMMGAMGGMAAEMERMTPALKAMAKEMGTRMGEAMRGAGGDYDARDDEGYRRDGPDANVSRDDDALPPSAQEEPYSGEYAPPADDDTQP